MDPRDPKDPLGLEDLEGLSPCLSCNFCTMNHPGRKPPDSPCTPWLLKPRDPRNPPEYRPEKDPFGLYGILRAITPKDLWKQRLKAIKPNALGGYRPETHKRVRLKDCPQPKKTRMCDPKPPWWWLRREVPQQVELNTPPPRITTAAYLGPRALLRPFFPEFSEDPHISISPERVHEIITEERARRLAGKRNLSLGGSANNVAELHDLKSPEVPEGMEETEPLRAMSLKKVTNIQFLKDYTAITEEDDDGQKD